MYKKTDKMYLYWLMDQYIMGEMDAKTFCNEYYYCHALELDLRTLTETEKKYFSELATVVGRFSEFDEDLKKYPGVYFNEKQLKEKIILTKNMLSK